jgi:hypothetical protein
MGQVHTFTSYFYIIYFDNILPDKHKTSKRSLPDKNPKTTYFSSGAYYIPESFSFSLILATNTNHEAPYYVAFFSLHLLPPSQGQIYSSALISQAVRSVFFSPYGKTNITVLQSITYIFFFDKTTERQTLVKETDANIPRISSVRIPFANEILSF